MIEALSKKAGVGTRLVLLSSLDKSLHNTCSGLDDDKDDNWVPGIDMGWIKSATAVVICGISSWESLNNPAEEYVSTVGADVVGKLEAGVFSAIFNVQDKCKISTDRIACCNFSICANNLLKDYCITHSGR